MIRGKTGRVRLFGTGIGARLEMFGGRVFCLILAGAHERSAAHAPRSPPASRLMAFCHRWASRSRASIPTNWRTSRPSRQPCRTVSSWAMDRHTMRWRCLIRAPRYRCSPRRATTTLTSTGRTRGPIPTFAGRKRSRSAAPLVFCKPRSTIRSGSTRRVCKIAAPTLAPW